MRYALVGGACLGTLVCLQLLANYLGGDDGPAWGPVASFVISTVVSILFLAVLTVVTDDDTYHPPPTNHHYPYR